MSHAHLTRNSGYEDVWYNPTSNKIYEAIGYEPVRDIDAYEFRQLLGG